MCVTCHATNPNSGIEVRQAHRRLAVERAGNYSYNILAIDFLGPGLAPDVTFSITDPQNGDAPYDLANDPELASSPIRFNVSWSTVDYSNVGNGLELHLFNDIRDSRAGCGRLGRRESRGACDDKRRQRAGHDGITVFRDH